jgi:hypothetical protein
LSNSQNNNKKKQKSTAITNKQGSGSEYHRDHAGNVEGYGEPYPIRNTTEDTDQ